MAFNPSVARIFLSSTFRDFGEERDLLVRKVFPALRARLKARLVELVDVDLRWGITADQAERGEVLPICLAEIDRARPFFVGMLGERYGWVAEADAYAPDLIERQPWLQAHRGGKSVTELEILHGVLNDPAMAGRAFFYFRSPAYAQSKGADYVAASPQDQAQQLDLKARIRASGFPVVEDYPDPQAFADKLESDLWQMLDAAYPQEDVPDAFERDRRIHEAYAAPRRRLYLGGTDYINRLDKSLKDGDQWLLISGTSGGGKSALLVNWLTNHRRTYPGDHVFEHYSSANADAADPAILVRRLAEAIRRETGSLDEIATDPQDLLDSLPQWLAIASSHAQRTGSRWIIALDALNSLSDLRDLRWWPQYLPQNIHLVVSCLSGPVMDILASKAAWTLLPVEPLTGSDCRDLLRAYLAKYNKTLPADLEQRALDHALASNPLFLRTLAEELRLFGVHEELEARLGYYLQSQTVDDLFECVLARVEADGTASSVQATMQAIWASRSGLTEEEILSIAHLVPATWAPIRHALDEALQETAGRISFAHDYMRIAVSDRYMAGNNQLASAGQSPEALTLRRQAHLDLADWFQARPVDARSAEELPHQWRKAQAWEKLKACLTGQAMFEQAMASRGSQEMLSYWLDLEQHAGADIESDYETAWGIWKLDQTAKATGDLADSLREFLSEAGRYKTFTETLARLSLRINEALMGPEHPDTGGSLNNLASLLHDKGDYHAAEPLCRRALAIAEKVLGPEHPDTGTSLNSLARLLWFKGDCATAEPLSRRALSIAEKSLGVTHENTGLYLSNLAGVLHDIGNYVDAEPLYRRALAIAEAVEGSLHPDTGSCLSDLADLLQDMGDYDAAEPLYRRALAIAEKAQGPEHPDTGTRLNNLALLFQANGDYDAAEPLHRRALAIAEKAQGPEHPSTVTSLNNLALLFQSNGDYDAAEPLYRRALAIAEKAQGPEHPSTGTSLNNLASLLHHKGDYAAAEPLLRRALAIAEKVQGPEHPTSVDRRAGLSAILKKLGRKGDTNALLSRGDFVSITQFAKAVANGANADELQPLHFLAGTLVAVREDKIWGKEIGAFLNVAVTDAIKTECKTNHIDLGAKFPPSYDKARLSGDLKAIIGKNTQSSTQEFIGDLAKYVSAA